MQYKLTHEEFSAASESVQALYVKKGDMYVMDVDITESDDYQKLVNNRNDILDEKKDEEKKRLALEEKNESEHINQLEKDQEYKKALELKSEKFKSELQKSKDKETTLTMQLEDLMRDTAVSVMSLELAGEAAELIKPHIKARTVMKEVDGQLKMFITDVTGNASAMTNEQLMAEFRENKLFAPILQGKKSSGGGTDPSNNDGSGAGSLAEIEAHFSPETRNLTMQSKVMVDDPEMYKKMRAKYPTSGRAGMFKGIG